MYIVHCTYTYEKYTFVLYLNITSTSRTFSIFLLCYLYKFKGNISFPLSKFNQTKIRVSWMVDWKFVGLWLDGDQKKLLPEGAKPFHSLLWHDFFQQSLLLNCWLEGDIAFLTACNMLPLPKLNPIPSRIDHRDKFEYSHVSPVSGLCKTIFTLTRN